MKEDIVTDSSLEWHGNPEVSTVLPAPEQVDNVLSLPLKQAIFKISGPAIGSMLIIMVFNLIDIWWVSKLGAEALAGISAASFILWALQALATLAGTGINSLVARYIGSGRRSHASTCIGQGLLLTVLLSVVLTLLGLIFQKSIFTKMGLEGMIFQHAIDYQSIILYGLFAIFTAFAVDSAFRGTGDTHTPLKVIAAGLTLNMILDPLLIFGYGPFPELQAGGAALATVIAHLLIAVILIFLLPRRSLHIAIHWKRHSLVHFPMLKRIIHIGSPIAFNGVMFCLSYMILTTIITDYGYNSLAALGLGHRIEGISYNMSVGFSFAAATLVGQYLGARRPRTAEKAAWLCVLYISIILAILSIVFYFFGSSLIRLFISDPAVIAEGADYLKIIAIFEIFLGFEIVLEGAFGGAGNSLPPMMIAAPLTWLRIPLALFLAGTLGWGSTGIWWAISLTTGLKGIILGFWFKRGRWMKQTL
ncbi:MAG: MATE family efflux transporter [candidate division KSB1 bacterium]|nr:MATE family efflux transporter [candidate division KSB1 bacterium]